MSLTLTITLPFGRYAATPWGKHVNEGAVEWPPSPWRIVRALTSSWHNHHRGLAESPVLDALGLLCGAPRYHLPPSGNGVTRHYMPASDHTSGHAISTDLVLHAFRATAPDASLHVAWPVQPTDGQLDILGQLASTVSYLGRAESRVVLAVSTTTPPTETGLEPVPAGTLTSSGTIRLLVPDKPLDLDSVHQRSADLRRLGRSDPPATTWVDYPVIETIPVRRVDRPSPAITVMQFAIVGRGRPGIVEAALLADTAKRAITSRSKDRATLHGHGKNGAKREDGHRHAHYLVRNDRSGARADTLIVWAPEGIPTASVADLADLNRLFVPQHLRKRLGASVDLALEIVGTEEQLDPALTSESRTWTTVTPFTTRRHRKRRQSRDDFLQGAIRRDLRHRQLPSRPDEVDVETSDGPASGSPSQSASRFYRSRRLGRDTQHDGTHVRLTFAEPFTPQGLLALGSLSHFGLGLFVGDAR